MLSEKSPIKHLLRQLIDIKPEDVTLKFIFDNIRNYGISAAVVFYGHYLISNTTQTNTQYFNCLIGGLLIISGGILYLLNLCQAIMALTKLKTNRTFYTIIVIIIIATSANLFVEQVKKEINKKDQPAPQQTCEQLHRNQKLNLN